MSSRRSLKPRRKPTRQLADFKIIVPLIAILIVVIVVYSGSSDQVQENYTEVKVLVYSGENTDSNSITLIIKLLGEINNKNMTPGVKFAYGTSDVINSQTLAGYDVLIIAGSSDDFQYIGNEDVNVSDLKSFVSDGNGFIGICAGAYSGAKFTDTWYTEGWGLAPNVVNIPFLEIGNLTINNNSTESSFLGSTDRVISHINGPAMYTTSDDVITFATYDDGSYQGYAAIVGESYGKGRTILSGVHPELTPQQPDLMVKFIMWAYNGTYENNTTEVNSAG